MIPPRYEKHGLELLKAIAQLGINIIFAERFTNFFDRNFVMSDLMSVPGTYICIAQVASYHFFHQMINIVDIPWSISDHSLV